MSSPANNDIACVPPADINGYSIAQYGASEETSQSFEVVDSGGQATGISADWNDGTDEGQREIFEIDFTSSAPCVTKTITATFTICSEEKTLSKQFVIGNNCEPIVVPPPPPPPPVGCPAGRQLTGNVQWYVGNNNTQANVDLTHEENLWGQSAPYQTPILFPGVNGTNATVQNLNKNGYIAAQFTMPTGAPLNGTFFQGNPQGGMPMTMSISAACGDFSPANSNCVHNSNPEQNMVQWASAGSNHGNVCYLTPGQTYYINLKITDPSGAPPAGPGPNGATCTGATCYFRAGITY